ncbi:MAG: anion permease [Acidobacteria bacterium]|nr:anion permease [Acidobacteriota bacterium]
MSLHRRLASGAALIFIYLAVEYLLPKPASIAPEGWRLLGLFAATIGGLILQPVPGGAVVLTAVVLSALIGGLDTAQALGGYSDPIVWLVIAAFLISDALLKTGLARRIALFFVRTAGRSSLGVCYALSLTDMVLAGIIPSNAARSGGVVLPVARSIVELYDSRPGPTAGLLGAFLIAAVYQNVCVTAAMFMTGQASNPLAARIATDAFHYPLTPAAWFAAGIVPGLCSLAVLPLLVFRLNPPKIRRTPEARAFAAGELKRMGPVSRPEAIVLLVFAAVCLLWVTSPFHRIDITATALLGAVALILTGILSWEDVVRNKSAWSLFIWYGGLVQLGKALGETGVTRVFAHAVAARFTGESWPVLLAGALVVYFYSHYGFASITAHLLAMFTPFCAVLIAKGAPAGLVLFAFACFSNFAAGLTHYGTTPAPMYFAQNYLSLREWWKVGFAVSIVNLTIWSTVGFWWWKLIGLW